MRSWSAGKSDGASLSRTKSGCATISPRSDARPALYKQTLDKLGGTEAAIETVSTAIAKTNAELETAQEQLQAFVSALDV